MINGAEIRDNYIFKSLKEELVGPCAYGEELDINNALNIEKKAFNRPYTVKGTNEEILKISPTGRYGVGVIFPFTPEVDDESVPNLQESDPIEDEDEDDEPSSPIEISKQKLKKELSGLDDFDISLTNIRKPCSLGISFLLNTERTKGLHVVFKGAVYRDFLAGTEGFSRKWWYRIPFQLAIDLKPNEFTGHFQIPLTSNDESLKDIVSGLFLEGVGRPLNNNLLITIALVNRKPDEKKTINVNSIFQSELSIKEIGDTESISIYPATESLTDDARSNDLLYRFAPVFAKGHGCAVNWSSDRFEFSEFVNEVFTESLPCFETPDVSPEVKLEDGSNLSIYMKDLSEIDKGSKGDLQIVQLLNSYKTWINKQRESLNKLSLSGRLNQIGLMHLDKCDAAYQRMQYGYNLIHESDYAFKAFRLANKAMLEQQKHAPKNLRIVKFDKDGHPIPIEQYKDNPSKGAWRPFQIGFLLSTIGGLVDKENTSRDDVELIWFPTGGGKTEAYLAVAAFTLLYERLVDPIDSSGVQVIMRYTLRLLTTQQLLRASTLICCLEVIRQEYKIGGSTFSIGLWVGGSNTPNKREHALKTYSRLTNAYESNPFLLDRCPYCSSQIGVIGKGRSKKVVGYSKTQTDSGRTITYKCSDKSCTFSGGIPVYVIDEDIFIYRPSVVIGTVDKFALLPWKPEIRYLFGLDNHGNRELLPPQLIIQDELHLISGPLGTMVALYEPLIEYLCTDNRGNKNTKPKIVCATATTSGYKEQIRNIYGRNKVNIFPSLGISAEDSFFSTYKRDLNKKLMPGRKYVGVCAPGLSSFLTTQVRSNSILLFASNKIDIEHRDPWVTLLCFYNSIRELGGALTLFQSDIDSYLGECKKRYPYSLLPRRDLTGFELTSRLTNEEIPKAITKLEKKINTDNLAKIIKKAFTELETYNHDYPNVHFPELKKNYSENKNFTIYDYYLVDESIKDLRRRGVFSQTPKALKDLIEIIRNKGVMDFCLASSIIEVGVDIDRLSLMTIIGQPKTSAQYIQVSGRVGRRSYERPGLVVTLYNNSRARDKSHYEDFRGYHQQLYSHVEPASVTPFSRPALLRGLAATAIGYVRQTSDLNSKPKQVLKSKFYEWLDILMSYRKTSMIESEKLNIERIFDKNFSKWESVKEIYTEWGAMKFNQDPNSTDLLVTFGASKSKGQLTCPTSMRNVDGNSDIQINSSYILEDEEEDPFDS